MKRPVGSSRASKSPLIPALLVWRKLNRARQPSDRKRSTCTREEATCGNDIQQEYFVDRRTRSVVSIFRVPKFLKDSKNQKAYVPQAVSLGPYHCKGANLSGMDDHKKRALLRMMTRFNNKHGNYPLDRESYKSAIRRKICQVEKEIWNNYEEKFVDKPCDLALDGCFILEILRTLGGDELLWEGSNYYEPIFEMSKIQFTGFDILNDILKLENQIPLIVLRKLLELELISDDTTVKYLFDALVTIFYPFGYEYDRRDWSWQPQHEQVHHLLGLLHSLIVSPPSDDCSILIDNNENAIQINNKGRKNREFIPPAVELSNAGIEFRRCSGGIKNICFSLRKATVVLPLINVTDYTEVLFRNLVALELCQASLDNYVTCYLSLMNSLINTDEDVGLLRNSGIIKNYLGSDAEVAELFHGLCKGVTLPRQDIFEQLQDDVMAYYKSKFRVLFAKFKKTYFSAWTIPVILGLLLTLVQTIYAIVQHK